MKKISLIATLLLAALLLQNCKKDTYYGTTTSTEPLIATINDTTWIATSFQASITYNAASKTKVFSCTGLANNQQVNFYATQQKASNTPGFPLATFNVDSTTNVAFSYKYPQKDNSGNLVLTAQGVVGPGSGSLTVTAIDSVKKTITGTFYFSSIKNNYDSKGNIISVSHALVSAGGFNTIPYTFTSN